MILFLIVDAEVLASGDGNLGKNKFFIKQF